MKWFKSIFFSLLLLVSNSGIAANYHWCAGELMDASISWGADELSCGMSEMETCPTTQDSPSDSGQSSYSPQSCCDQGSSVLNVDDELRQSTVDLSSVSGKFIVAFVLAFSTFNEEDENYIEVLRHEPLPSRESLYILHCSYLI
ncbi:MAG: hypothetical protein EP346_06585 [Bacteroidetes bacterium]|nr:MAG: hypothetical protein EP346_06585 [Bacteroidota bacterium]